MAEKLFRSFFDLRIPLRAPLLDDLGLEFLLFLGIGRVAGVVANRGASNEKITTA